MIPIFEKTATWRYHRCEEKILFLRFSSIFLAQSVAYDLLNHICNSPIEGGGMSKPIIAGVTVGGVFALAIIYGAAAMAFDAGGFVLIAALVDGLFAALCIAGLIAANFALAAGEKIEAAGEKRTPVQQAA
jgi:hypothetical protein